MYPVATQLICSITSIVTIGYITLLRGNLGLTGRQYLNLARLEKTSGAILPYRPSRKLQKNSCLTVTLSRSPIYSTIKYVIVLL